MFNTSDPDATFAHQPSTSDLEIRPVRSSDAPALTELMNEIIAQGGTTAFERPFTVEELDAQYLTGPKVISAVVAIDRASQRPQGFQILGDFGHPLPTGWGDIGTYVQVGGKQRGIGSALFGATRAKALERGLIAINATIRSDNAGGLAYYSKQRFEDYAVERAVPLADGTPVDRIYKRYWLDKYA
jgi:L-amino acid N-acyltransferase YncA